jgi:hypothetical protein
VRDNGLGHRNGKTAGDSTAKALTQVKPYAITDPIAYAVRASARRYLQTKWRHTTKAAIEHPQNEHECRRAERTGVGHAVLVVCITFAFVLPWAWLSFSWDALKATTTAWRERPDKARAVVEGTFAITAALTFLALTTEGWGLLQAVKAAVVFGLFTFPLVFAFVMRREIRWCSDVSERKRLARQDHDGDDPSQDAPLLTLGEAASPPGLARARRMRGDDRA